MYFSQCCCSFLVQAESCAEDGAVWLGCRQYFLGMLWVCVLSWGVYEREYTGCVCVCMRENICTGRLCVCVQMMCGPCSVSAEIRVRVGVCVLGDV